LVKARADAGLATDLDVAQVPRFAILGNFGHRSDELGGLPAIGSQFWSFIPGVRWPILSGGRIRANIRVQGARQEQAQKAYERRFSRRFRTPRTHCWHTAVNAIDRNHCAWRSRRIVAPLMSHSSATPAASRATCRCLMHNGRCTRRRMRWHGASTISR
jgi:hypothetical protein